MPQLRVTFPRPAVESLVWHNEQRYPGMTGWIPFENGTTVGTTGSEGGTILRDELHPDGARITLERTASQFAITCGVYGWMVHTRFFDVGRCASEGGGCHSYGSLSAEPDSCCLTDASTSSRSRSAKISCLSFV